MRLDQRDATAFDCVAVLLFWTSAITGIVLPWVVFIMTQGNQSQVRLWRELWGPQPGLLRAGVVNAGPFLVYAVFALIHLGKVAPLGAATAYRRLIAVMVAGCVMTAVSLWINIALWTSRSSTAA